MSEQLKPCPFCGGDAILNDPGGSSADCYDITIRCLDCDAEVACMVDQDHNTDGGAEAKAEVIQHWNRRTPDLAAAVHAEREACVSVAYGALPKACDTIATQSQFNTATYIAVAIRARGDTDALARMIAEAEAPLLALLWRWLQSGCPDCGGDCASANPPITYCIMQKTEAAIRAGALGKGKTP